MPLDCPMPDTQTITKSDFRRLAVAAWLRDPLKSLADQMSEDVGLKPRTCEYYLAIRADKMPPNWIIKRAHALADQEAADLSEVLDRTAQTVAALADDRRPEDKT